MTDTPSPLHDAAFMRAFLDTVIPPTADGKMPGAGSLGLEASLASVVEADARSGPAIIEGLTAIRATGDFAALAPAARVAAIETQANAQPALMPSLLRHLYQLYYQDIRVLLAIGEPGRPPFPEGFEVEQIDPDLLALIERRGKEMAPR